MGGPGALSPAPPWPSETPIPQQIPVRGVFSHVQPCASGLLLGSEADLARISAGVPTPGQKVRGDRGDAEVNGESPLLIGSPKNKLDTCRVCLGCRSIPTSLLPPVTAPSCANSPRPNRKCPGPGEVSPGHPGHKLRYWDEFHTCALTVLWECQKEAAAIWEMLRRESRKIKFQGSLFDLCSPTMAQSFAWTHVPNASVLGIPLVITWLNL
ncbi:uncharacterized protein VSU04_011194 [Chlamydotis macqueenii]